MIEILKYDEVSTDKKKFLNEIIHAEFGHIPIVRETEWATPDWTIIYYEKNEIAAFYNIVDRTINTDDKKVRVAGINNVITLKAYRGRGYASKILSSTESLIFDKLKFEAGLLLCADALVPFYERLNWYVVDCPVYIKQPTGEKLWTANTMLLTKSNKLNPVFINLNGFPW